MRHWQDDPHPDPGGLPLALYTVGLFLMSLDLSAIRRNLCPENGTRPKCVPTTRESSIPAARLASHPAPFAADALRTLLLHSAHPSAGPSQSASPQNPIRLRHSI